MAEAATGGARGDPDPVRRLRGRNTREGEVAEILKLPPKVRRFGAESASAASAERRPHTNPDGITPPEYVKRSAKNETRNRLNF